MLITSRTKRDNHEVSKSLEERGTMSDRLEKVFNGAYGCLPPTSSHLCYAFSVAKASHMNGGPLYISFILHSTELGTCNIFPYLLSLLFLLDTEYHGPCADSLLMTIQLGGYKQFWICN